MSDDQLILETRLRDTCAALRLVMPQVLRRERAIAHTKWYAYRFMSPLEATSHFADLYRASFKRYIRFHRDLSDGDAAEGLGSRILGQPSRSLTELWNARQRADALGLPYDLLIEFGFHFAGRRTRKRAPRPGQLFGGDETDIAWPLEIEKWIVDPLRLALQRLDMAQYRAENYRSFPVQDEFREYVLESMAETTGAWGPKLAHHCVSRRHAPVSTALKLVPKGARKFAIRHLRGELELDAAMGRELELLPDIALGPACFGIPFSFEETTSECISCPLSGLCSTAVSAASAHMHGRYGAVSPLDQNRRSNTNEKTKLRVRKCRARKQNGAREGSHQSEECVL